MRRTFAAALWVLPICLAAGQSAAAPATPAAPAAPTNSSAVEGCLPAEANQPEISFNGNKMVAVCRDAYADPQTTPEERVALQHSYADASKRVAEIFGQESLRRRPVAILCKSDDCVLHFAGPARRSWTVAPHGSVPGAQYVAGDGYTVVIVHAEGGAQESLTHEMVHVEMLFHTRHEFVPQWFNEGAATFFAGGHGCDRSAGRGIDDLRRLDESSAWAEYTNHRDLISQTYCQARAEFDAWLSRFGRERFLKLLDDVRDGAPFYDVYGPMLTQDPVASRQVLLSRAVVTLDGTPDSDVVTPGIEALADGHRAFSLALWIKPVENSGVLAHVSHSPDGAGWCNPFLGFNSSHQLVSQVVHGHSPELSSFSVAIDPMALPLEKWTHVAMTWSPGSFNRLYVNGKEVAKAEARWFSASNSGPMYVTWGSSNIGGWNCWQGAISPGGFKGSIAQMRVYPSELSATEVAALAAKSP
jgi:hypothetical protein